MCLLKGKRHTVLEPVRVVDGAQMIHLVPVLSERTPNEFQQRLPRHNTKGIGRRRQRGFRAQGLLGAGYFHPGFSQQLQPHGLMAAYEGEIEEGDIILTNDPYMCGAAVSHLPDWIVLVPIFKDRRHIAWSAMFGHMSDNGGMTPESIPVQATTIFQEGIRIPPTRLYKKGEL